MHAFNYASQLYRRWGVDVFKKLYRMIELHSTPFETILGGLFDTLDDYNGRFTFPTVAAIANMRPDDIRGIASQGHEVASHGFNHLQYTKLSKEERERDLELSLYTFRRINVPIQGFRAPYNNYTDDMTYLLEKYGLTWDGGYGYRTEHREKNHFFNVDLGDKKSSVTYIPLNVLSDDRLIDRMGLKPESVTKRLNQEVRRRAKAGGVTMFDLHPIRIGQPEYVGCVGEVLEHAHGLGAWSTTPAEAVRRWKSHGRWKGDSSFCLLLTGDIDCWTISDYLRRILWSRHT